jgi:diguanylate cyclase (GGDEF)-like protein/excisionase family DNA binding protein
MDQLSPGVREHTASAIRQRSSSLISDVAANLSHEGFLDASQAEECAGLLIGMLATAIQVGELDTRAGALQELSRFTPPLTVRQLVRSLHRAERTVLDELALHERLGATSESWPMVAHAVRAAMVEVAASIADRRTAMGALRDPLTTLLSPIVFEFALAQETQRAQRHNHGVAMLLFDIDDLSALNRSHGFGAGDRLLERLGISARRYFRNHDWVARHGGDSIAVLLPETSVDDAAQLATRFSEMVRQRLVLVDHKTDAVAIVSVSAAAVGTDLVQEELDPDYIMAEAEAAVLRAKMNGGNRVERVALLPTSVTITGAATLLGVSPRDVVTLVRRGDLRATRRGRHYHIDREVIEEYRRRG